MARFRKNGLQRPISRDQKISMILYPIISLAYYLMIILLMKSTTQFLILLLPHLCFCILSIISWYAVETIDPIEIKDEKTTSLICFKTSKVQTRYCGTCRKSVAGLDHHCVWLNTCIGTKNYIPFLILVVCGFFQMIWQTIVNLLYMTIWFDKELKSLISSCIPQIIYYLLLSILCFLSTVVTIMFGVLLSFHLYLLFWARMGTYEFLLTRGDPSKGEDSFNESKKQYLANEAERYQKQQAWIQTISKPSPLSADQIKPLPFSFPSTPNAPAAAAAAASASSSLLSPSPPMILASISNEVEMSTLQAGLSSSQPPPSSHPLHRIVSDGEAQPLSTQITIQSTREGDDLVSLNTSTHLTLSTTNSNPSEEIKESNPFRSLYLRASQVFPMSSSPSPSSHDHSKNIHSKHPSSSRGGGADLPPHPELSYHSIVSHQESIHSNIDV